MSLWVFFAVIMTFGKALGALVNEYFQVKAIHLLFWVRLICLVVLLPGAFFFPPPQDVLFYVYLVGASFLIPYADILYMGLAAKSGAGVVTRILPLAVVFMFFIYLPFSPELVMGYFHQPLRAAGIVASIAGAVYFASRLKDCEVSFETLKKLIPAFVLWGVAISIGKVALDRIEDVSTVKVLYYMLIQSVVVLGSYMLLMGHKKLNGLVPHMGLQSCLFSSRTLLAGLCGGVIYLVTIWSKWMAIDVVENPAYVSVIGLAAPFFVMLVYKLVGKREDAHIGAGIGIIACAALLILFTKF